MTDDRPTLREIAQIASTLHGGARGRELDRVAKKHGLTLSYTTFDKILSGTYTSRPKRATLDALARLAGMQRHIVYEAAGLTLEQKPFQEQLPPDVDELRPEQRRLLIDLARGLLTQNRRESELKLELAQLKERDGSGSAAPNTRPAGDPGGNQHHDDEEAPAAEAAGAGVPADLLGLAAFRGRTPGMEARDAIDTAGEEPQIEPEDDDT